MPTKILNRYYQNNYRPELVNWLLGNIGDWQTITIDAEAGVYYEASIQQSVSVEFPNKITFNNGQTAHQLGFFEGDTNCHFKTRVTDSLGGDITLDLLFDILEINGSQITTVLPIFGNQFPAVLPTRTVYGTTDFWFDEVVVWNDKRPEAIEIYYNQSDNNNPDDSNLNSLYDSTKTRLQVEGINLLAPLSTLPFDLLGKQSGTAIAFATVQYVQKNGLYKYEHRIIITYLLGQFYDDKGNFEDNEAPISLIDDNSLNDIFQITFFPTFNNPNLGLVNVLKNTYLLGNTGWFDENFNGIETDMNLQAVVYTDIANTVSFNSLDFGSPRKMTMLVGNVPNISASTKVSFGISWITNTEDHTKSNTFGYHQNHFMNTGGINTTYLLDGSINAVNSQGFSQDGLARIDTINHSGSVFIGSALLTMDVYPTPEFTAFMLSREENDRNYVVWINVGDQTLITNFSDRVAFKEYNEFTFEPVPVGPHAPFTFDFGNHPNEDDEFDLDYTFLTEDEVLMTSKFSIDPLIHGTLINSETKFEAFNTVTNEHFDLDGVNINTSSAVISAGVQEINSFNTKGYLMNSGNNKNYLNLFRNPANDGGGLFAYCLQVGFQPRWEYWLENGNISSDFYDVNLPNNGLNNNWRPFDGGDWVLRANVQLTWSRIDGTTEVTENTVEFNNLTYDESTEFEGEMKIFEDETLSTPIPVTIDTDGEELSTLDVSQQNVLVFDFSRIDNTPVDVTNHFGVMRFQEFDGAGQMALRRLSSVWTSEPNNPLIPLSTETKLRVEQLDPLTGRIICKIDPTKFDNTKPLWWLSGRIGFYCVQTSQDLEWIQVMWECFKTTNPHFDLDNPDPNTILWTESGFDMTVGKITNFFFEHFAPCSYYVNVYGPSGLNKNKCDWFMMYFTYGDTLSTGVNDTDGNANLVWNVEGNYTFAENVNSLQSFNGQGIIILSSLNNFNTIDKFVVTQTNFFGVPSIQFYDNTIQIQVSNAGGGYINNIEDLILRPSNVSVNNFYLRAQNINLEYNVNSYRPNAYGNFHFAFSKMTSVIFPTNLIVNDTNTIDMNSMPNWDNTKNLDWSGLTLNECTCYLSSIAFRDIVFPANSNIRYMQIFGHSSSVALPLDLQNCNWLGTFTNSRLQIRSNTINGVILNPANSYIFDQIMFFATLLTSFNSVTAGVWDFNSSPVSVRSNGQIQVQSVSNAVTVILPTGVDNILLIRLTGSAGIILCDLSTMTTNQNGINLLFNQTGISLDVNLQLISLQQIETQGWLNGVLTINTNAGLTPPNAASLIIINNLVTNRGWTITHD